MTRCDRLRLLNCGSCPGTKRAATSRSVPSVALLRLIAAIISLSSAADLNAQRPVTGSIRGQVLREEDRTPLRGSRVQLTGVVPARSSNAKGEFSFDRLSPHSYHLRVISLGYAPVDTLIVVRPGAVERVTVIMRAAPVQLAAVTVREAANPCASWADSSSAYDPTGLCAPKKPPTKPCGALFVVSLTTMICTSGEMLVMTAVYREATFLGPHSQILEAAQEAVRKLGMAIARVRQLNDATWLITGSGVTHEAGTDSIRVELQEVDGHDTTVRVTLRAYTALGTRRQEDAARSLLAGIRRKINSKARSLLY